MRLDFLAAPKTALSARCRTNPIQAVSFLPSASVPGVHRNGGTNAGALRALRTQSLSDSFGDISSIAVSVKDEVLQQAQKAAAEKHTTVDRLVREFLMRLRSITPIFQLPLPQSE